LDPGMRAEPPEIGSEQRGDLDRLGVCACLLPGHVVVSSLSLTPVTLNPRPEP